MEERNPRLSGDRASQHGLPTAGRTEQQDAFGDLGSQRLELLGVFEEFDDLLQLLLGLFDTRDLFKGDFGNRVRHPLGAAAPKVQRLIAARLRLSNKEEPEDDQ